MEQLENTVNWFEIYVNDIKRAQKFYETVLNRKMTDMSKDGNKHKMVMFGKGDLNQYGTNGALVQMPQMKAGGNSIMVYFYCEDCAVEQNRVEMAGGKVLRPKFSIGEYGFCSWCIDTEGNQFGLQSMK